MASGKRDSGNPLTIISMFTFDICNQVPIGDKAGDDQVSALEYSAENKCFYMHWKT